MTLLCTLTAACLPFVEAWLLFYAQLLLLHCCGF